MDLSELLTRLDIETPDRLEYFEQYAELAETEDDIPADVLAEFFADVNADTLRELTDAYFEEILSGVPDSRTEFYLLLSNIGRSLTGLAGSSDAGDGDLAGSGGAGGLYGDDARRSYAEEFFRFRHWYTMEPNVSHGAARLSVLEALATMRAGILTGHADPDEAGEKFDFSDALAYEVDEYAISLGELLIE
ncbi:MAG: hypothetical protein LBC58_03590 [Clostridiales Family XIII bacterium]|nr:hypothetical protein [Clostridiales Family XIII bacterium]